MTSDPEPDFVTREELLTYFPERGWYGASFDGPSPEVTVRGEEEYDRHALYQCKDCAALTTSPESHVEWHKRLNRPVKSSPQEAE